MNDTKIKHSYLYELIKNYGLSLLLYPIIVLILMLSVFYSGTKSSVRAESEYLIAYSRKNDVALAVKIHETLYNEASKLRELFGVNSKIPIDIRVYPNLSSYNTNITELHPRWAQSQTTYVTGEDGNVSVISLHSEFSENNEWYDEEYILRNAKISLAEIYLDDKNYKFSKVPSWLSEGVAFYFVANDEDRNHIINVVRKNSVPASEIMNSDLDRSNRFSLISDNYTASHGREFAYVFIDFFVSKYDENTVLKWGLDKKFMLSDTGYNDYDELYYDLNQFIKTKYID